MSSGDIQLPGEIGACLFDLDGVLTDTAALHDEAWKEMFDGFLREWATRERMPFVPFDPIEDYEKYIDGKARFDGVRSFLASRRIELPEGSHQDPPVADTVGGLGNRKNELVLAKFERFGVVSYEGSVRFVLAARAAGLRCAVVSASANCRQVLDAAGIADLFETQVDGVVAEECGLRGKPAPDTFLAAARILEVQPDQAAVFEDALAGVEAGRAGKFGLVVGVDRVGQASELRAHGADLVVSDLAELLTSA
jgi:beta-phosphoglucomutase family hydrolase